MRVEHRKAIGAVLLLALLMTYKVAVTMFVHTHNVEGTMVAHSHPFTNSNHSHSSSQILVNGLEHAVCDEIKVYHNSVEEIEYVTHDLNVINERETGISLRAPPVCC